MNHSDMTSVQDHIAAASDSALLAMLESVETAVEDRRRQRTNTFFVDETALKSRLVVLDGLIDVDDPYRLWTRYHELVDELKTAVDLAENLRKTVNKAQDEAQAATVVYRKATRQLRLERQSIEAQLNKLRAARKRKALALDSGSNAEKEEEEEDEK